jgi:hypothetical protein
MSTHLSVAITIMSGGGGGRRGREEVNKGQE